MEKDYQSPLNYFHPLVTSWFAESVGMPTDVQMQAWPRIAAGEHVLIAAPTGSGKTMAAFLWAINELITGKWPLGRTCVLYVSPLKALNNDIRRNLTRPLSELEAEREPPPAESLSVREPIAMASTNACSRAGWFCWVTSSGFTKRSLLPGR
jgi:Lhr-like helicase